MKKKFRRKEREKLIRKIEKLENELRCERIRTAELENDYLKAERRLRDAGSEIETIDYGCGPVQIIQAKAELYGDYFTCIGELNTRLQGEAKENLIREMVKGLIEQNMIQFIIKKPGEFGGTFGDALTIGAKLFVIPWEQMRTGRTVEIRRKI